MKSETFLNVYLKLCDAFNVQRVNEGMPKVYAERLCKIPDRILIRACDEIIDNEQRFPTIATILNYCHEIRQLPHQT